MGLPTEEEPRRATCADLDAAPPNKVAELINGALHVFPRPSITHARTSSRLVIKLGGPFDLGEGGPGGWRLLAEPDLHLGPTDAPDHLVPDLAGWRVARMPTLPRASPIALPPDWICEVVSRRTEATDRADKMPIYAREGVHHAWLVDPILRTFEIFALGDDGLWNVRAVHQGEKRVRAEPFEAIELDLALLWPDDDAADDEEENAVTVPARPASTPREVVTKARKRTKKKPS